MTQGRDQRRALLVDDLGGLDTVLIQALHLFDGLLAALPVPSFPLSGRFQCLDETTDLRDGPSATLDLRPDGLGGLADGRVRAGSRTRTAIG